MSKKIIQNISVSSSSINSTTVQFTKSINNLKFKPDYVKVKQLSMLNDPASTLEGIFILTSDLVDYQPLFSVAFSATTTDNQSYTTQLNNKFILSRDVNGTFTFYWTDSGDASISPIGNVSFILEFGKYL